LKYSILLHKGSSGHVASPDMNRKTMWLIVLVIGAGILVLATIGTWRANTTNKKGQAVKLDPEIFYEVTRVLDGDTFNIKVGKKEITVRILGINTPETVDPRRAPECYGKEASLLTKELLSHRRVRLELSPHREVRDKYGRYLAYVYRDDDVFINEYLLKEGAAKEYTYGRAYSLQRRFQTYEMVAQTQGSGLWGKCAGQNS
jgi:micrococcal nuclease